MNVGVRVAWRVAVEDSGVASLAGPTAASVQPREGVQLEAQVLPALLSPQPYLGYAEQLCCSRI